jgi:hypothetical protein
MIKNRRVAVVASLIGALFIFGTPVAAFADKEDGREDETVQKAKDEDNGEEAKKEEAKSRRHEGAKKEDGHKDDGKKEDGKKEDGNRREDAKKDEGDRREDAGRWGEDRKDEGRKDEGRKDEGRKDEGRKDEARKDEGRGDEGRRDDRRGDDGRKDEGDRREDAGRWDDRHDGDWKDREHGDERNRDWDHDRDRHHRRHDWDTHRRYYRYGYYGSGYYDDCGYYGNRYRGDGDDYSYYGPDACSYEYGDYGSHLLVRMSGDEVVPDRGPRDAYGTANLDINAAAGRVCFRLAYDGIHEATAAQIHYGRPGENGPSVVFFHVGQNGDDGCVSADPRVLDDIRNHPEVFYLKVDSNGYPNGAMRGQLVAPSYRRY